MSGSYMNEIFPGHNYHLVFLRVRLRTSVNQKSFWLQRTIYHYLRCYHNGDRHSVLHSVEKLYTYICSTMLRSFRLLFTKTRATLSGNSFRAFYGTEVKPRFSQNLGHLVTLIIYFIYLFI